MVLSKVSELTEVDRWIRHAWLQPDYWQAVTNAVTAAFAPAQVVLYRSRGPIRLQPVSTSVEQVEELPAQSARLLQAMDLHVRGHRSMPLTGEALASRDPGGFSRLKAELLGPRRLGSVLVVELRRRRSVIGVLGVFRGEQDLQLAEPETQRLSALAPKLTEAAWLRRTLERHPHRLDAWKAVLDDLDGPAFLLVGQGTLAVVNTAARFVYGVVPAWVGQAREDVPSWVQRNTFELGRQTFLLAHQRPATLAYSAGYGPWVEQWGLSSEEASAVFLHLVGLTDSQIARLSMVAGRRVHGHIERVYGRLGVSSRHDLLAAVERTL